MIFKGPLGSDFLWVVWFGIFFFLAKLLPEEYRTMSGSALSPSDLGSEPAAIEQREQRC